MWSNMVKEDAESKGLDTPLTLNKPGKPFFACALICAPESDQEQENWPKRYVTRGQELPSNREKRITDMGIGSQSRWENGVSELVVGLVQHHYRYYRACSAKIFVVPQSMPTRNTTGLATLCQCSTNGTQEIFQCQVCQKLPVIVETFR